MTPAPIHDLPEVTSEALQDTASRLQRAIEELFAAKAEAQQHGNSGELPQDLERVLEAATGQTPATVEPLASDGRSASSPAVGQDSDRRLYFPRPEGWAVQIKAGGREYCHSRQPDETWFHLLVDGELYLESGTSKICLNCALRQGLLTDNRLHWQAGRRGAAVMPSESLSGADGESAEIRESPHDEDHERSPP